MIKDQSASEGEEMGRRGEEKSRADFLNKRELKEREKRPECAVSDLVSLTSSAQNQKPEVTV